MCVQGPRSVHRARPAVMVSFLKPNGHFVAVNNMHNNIMNATNGARKSHSVVLSLLVQSGSQSVPN